MPGRSARLEEGFWLRMEDMVDGIVPETIVRQMNADNIFLWSGHNYAWEVVHQLGIPAEQGVVRIGIAHYNTAAEIDETLESAHRVIAMLRQQRS
ncbi:MAG: hypothetical protein E5X64_22040, partial [Mesorhizobium sp.]